MVQRIKDAGIRLKINTVVHQHNWQQDLNRFIDWAKPERWKVFQVLPVAGQNDAHFWELAVTSEQYDAYLTRHSQQQSLVPENNEAMTASYYMVDPAGRFFDNEQGHHRYSSPILEVGVKSAISEVAFEMNRFIARGGQYE